MTLEEAIKHCEEKSQGNSSCELEHRQLAEWLKELQRLKSLPSGLEEAAQASWNEYEYRESPHGLYSACYNDAFKVGAQWQKQQQDDCPKIKGWVARDEDGRLCLHKRKPKKYCGVFDEDPGVWSDDPYGSSFERVLPKEWFPEISWLTDPVEVELTIYK